MQKEKTNPIKNENNERTTSSRIESIETATAK